MSQDYYQLLGVPRTASDAEIKQAFRRKSRDLHPDVNPAPDAKQRFQELNTAYQTLSDPVRRSVYDRMSPHGIPGQRSYEPPASQASAPDWRYSHSAMPPAPPFKRASVSFGKLGRGILRSAFFWAGVLITVGVAVDVISHLDIISAQIQFLLCLPVLLILSVADALGWRWQIWSVVVNIVLLILGFVVIPFAPPVLLIQYAKEHHIEWLSTVSSTWVFVMVMGGEVVTGVAFMVACNSLFRRWTSARSKPASTGD